jgi:hypothetical protein
MVATSDFEEERSMRRKLLMLAGPLALLLASLSAPASALANCSCQYCATHGPDIVCKLPDGTTTNCVFYTTNYCP